jgi:predicted MFS family arabinose efflux permease
VQAGPGELAELKERYEPPGVEDIDPTFIHLSPAVMVRSEIPLIAADGDVETSSLALAWLGGAGFTLVGLALMIGVRPDPQKIARELAGEGPDEESAPESMARIIRRPGIPSAVVAAVASWSAMVTVMTLSGVALVAHGHDKTAIFPVLAAHFVGMFGLFLVVGRVIERVGRAPALIGGLILLGASSLGLVGAVRSVPLAAVSLFGIGLGWSFSYVAATTALAEHSAPAERGKVLGFADLVSGLAGAGLTVLGGVALVDIGVGAVAVGAASVALLAGLWMLALRIPRPA